MQYVNNYAYVHNCVLKIDGNYYGFDYNGYMYQDSEFRDLYNGEHRAKQMELCMYQNGIRIAMATGIIMMKLLAK